jgi:stage II sporulation protein D
MKKFRSAGFSSQSSVLNSKSIPFPIFPAFILIFLLCLFPVETTAANQPVIRLLVAENATKAVVRARSLAVERWDGRHWKRVLGGVSTLVFGKDGASVLLEGTGQRGSSMRIWAKDGTFSYNGKEYRGELLVAVQDNGLILVAKMPLETYLVGVVNGEVDSQWPLCAVMAQVVAARTYALYRIGLGTPFFDVRPDVLDQVYAGAGSEDERAVEAVRRTRGEVLYYEGEIFPAFFHSSCGGETASSLEVWGFDYSSMKGARCGECDDAPYSRWQLSLSPSQVRTAVGKLFSDARQANSLGIHHRTDDGRVLTLFFDTDEGRVLIDAGDFRKVLGYKTLPSTRFTMSAKDGKIIFTGSGYGHGVGLCQWGARGSALKGMDYRQILRKYYAGAEVHRAC